MNSTGNKAITGVGFTPKTVRFTPLVGASAAAGNLSVGAMTASAQYFMSIGAGASDVARNSATDACIGYVIGSTSTPILKASYVSLDADGFTINVTTATSIDVAYEAYA